jgi:hypothetical protein
LVRHIHAWPFVITCKEREGLTSTLAQLSTSIKRKWSPGVMAPSFMWLGLRNDASSLAHSVPKRKKHVNECL